MNGDRIIEYQGPRVRGPAPGQDDTTTIPRVERGPCLSYCGPITVDNADFIVTHFIRDPSYRRLSGYWAGERWRRLP